MIIIPAIDLKGGRCVRLLQGRMDAETVFSDNPAKMAKRWQDEGAEIIHLVDLDGAISKKPRNIDSIKEIIKSVDIPIHLGGGIRDIDTIRMYLKLGIKRIIIGTEAVKNPEMVKRSAKEFPGRIIIGIDAKDGQVAIEGWTKATKTGAAELARQFEDSGIFAINFTDIKRDGMESGPNIEETKKLAESVNIPVVASGGVSCIDDIKNLLSVESSGVMGVITGRALYNGSLNLKEAIALAKHNLKE